LEPVPASPRKCSLEMFVANRDAPIAIHPTFRPARKYCVELLARFRKYEPMAMTVTKYTAMMMRSTAESACMWKTFRFREDGMD